MQSMNQSMSQTPGRKATSPGNYGTNENPEHSFAGASPFQLNTAAKRDLSSPLRQDITQSPYPLANQSLSSPMPARGAPLADMTNISLI